MKVSLKNIIYGGQLEAFELTLIVTVLHKCTVQAVLYVHYQ